MRNFLKRILHRGSRTLERLADTVERPRSSRKMEDLVGAHHWIWQALSAQSITISTSRKQRGYWRPLIFRANLRPDQEILFERIIAEAVSRFPDLTLEELCAELEPLHPLNEAWAREHGLDDWAEDAALPCARCGAKFYSYWVFGRKTAAKLRDKTRERWNANNADPYPGDADRLEDANFCPACLEGFRKERAKGPRRARP